MIGILFELKSLGGFVCHQLVTVVFSFLGLFFFFGVRFLWVLFIRSFSLKAIVSLKLSWFKLQIILQTQMFIVGV